MVLKQYPPNLVLGFDVAYRGTYSWTLVKFNVRVRALRSDDLQSEFDGWKGGSSREESRSTQYQA